jgi:DNA polymerase-3 subunit beta
MILHCEKSILLTAVNTTSRAVALRNAQPALEGLLLSVENGLLCITGYNLEIGIVVKIPVDAEKEGSIIAPTKMLQDILRKLPDQSVSISADDQLMITIRCGLTEFNLPGLSSLDFPKMPEIDQERSFMFKQNMLRDIISRITYALSENESRIINTGALFDLENGVFHVVALDGYRLALRRCEANHGEDNFQFIVPGAALRELEKILREDDDSKLKIVLSRRHIQFVTEEAALVSRLLEGEFLNYQKAIPTQHKYSIIANRKSLLSAVERVSLVIHEKIRSPVRLTFQNGNINLFCQTALGRGNDHCECKGDGENLEIGFNNRYLIDALRAVEDEDVVIGLSGSLNPCVIYPEDGDRYINMVLPQRLRTD